MGSESLILGLPELNAADIYLCPFPGINRSDPFDVQRRVQAIGWPS